jgi:hypothetical protein
MVDSALKSWTTPRSVAVVDGVRAEVDVGRDELLDQAAERVGLGQARDLVTELELLEDLLHVGREAIEVRLEVRLELGLAGPVSEVAQGEL